MEAGWDDVSTAVQVSAYSLKSLAVAALPLMAAGGSVVGLTFDAQVRLAGLRLDGRGQGRVRVDQPLPRPRPGPQGDPLQPRRGRPDPHHRGEVDPGLRAVRGGVGRRGPRSAGTSTTPMPAARACVALLSDWFPATTGEIVHVDGGFHAMGAVAPTGYPCRLTPTRQPGVTPRARRMTLRPTRRRRPRGARPGGAQPVLPEPGGQGQPGVPGYLDGRRRSCARSAARLGLRGVRARARPTPSSASGSCMRLVAHVVRLVAARLGHHPARRAHPHRQQPRRGRRGLPVALARRGRGARGVARPGPRRPARRRRRGGRWASRPRRVAAADRAG